MKKYLTFNVIYVIGILYVLSNQEYVLQKDNTTLIWVSFIFLSVALAITAKSCLHAVKLLMKKEYKKVLFYTSQFLFFSLMSFLSAILFIVAYAMSGTIGYDN